MTVIQNGVDYIFFLKTLLLLLGSPEILTVPQLDNNVHTESTDFALRRYNIICLLIIA